MTDKVRNALEAAFKLLGAIEQNPKRRYATADVRAQLMEALGEVSVSAIAPLEPTAEMLSAFHSAIRDWMDEIGEDADVYKAMIKATK